MPKSSLSQRDTVAAAVEHLRKNCRHLKGVIDAVGPFTLKLRRDRFESLVRAIVWQQISGKAATSIFNKLLEQLDEGRVAPETLLALTPEQFRTAGISPQKLKYLCDLATKVNAGEVRLAKIGRMTDDAVVAELTQVLGVGEWTAQMFLIFTLGRLDVFPHADLGIRSAIRKLHGLDDLPDKTLSHQLAEPWRPYASVASWYLWRSLDAPPDPKKPAVKRSGSS
jgi:DNA-3-methyladenine glycosylase II